MPERDDFTHDFGPVSRLPERDPTPPEVCGESDLCECNHARSSHANGLWECRWCACREYRSPQVPDIFEDSLDIAVCPLCEAAGHPPGVIQLDSTNWGFCPQCNPGGRHVTLVRIASEGWTEHAPGTKQRPTPAAPTHGDLCLKLSRARAALERIAGMARSWDRRGRPVADMLMIGGECEQALREIESWL